MKYEVAFHPPKTKQKKDLDALGNCGRADSFNPMALGFEEIEVTPKQYRLLLGQPIRICGFASRLGVRSGPWTIIHETGRYTERRLGDAIEKLAEKL